MGLAEAAIDFRQIGEEQMGSGGLYVYDTQALVRSAEELQDLDLPNKFTVRYAAKANPHPEIVDLFNNMGLHFEASSIPEAEHLMQYGVEGDKISLSSQVLWPDDIDGIFDKGVLPVATSATQVRTLGAIGIKDIAIRVNPGIGYGHNNRTNVGGSASSFGIWHQDLIDVVPAAMNRSQTINRLHTHIGSGADSDVWREVIRKSLAIVEVLPDVKTLDIGGGYKVARMPGETSTNMTEVAQVFGEELVDFENRTGRVIDLEIEPGSMLVANAGTLLGRVVDIKKTDVYNFLILNVGMNALLRPSHYGSQHPIEVLNDAAEQDEYLVSGPCCEAGDTLTPMPDDPEGIKPRLLNKVAIGDIVAIGGAGAYGATMAPSQYNAIPHVTELMV